MRFRVQPVPRTSILLLATGLVLGGCTARQSQDQYEERLEQALVVRQGVSEQLDQDSLDDPEAFDFAGREVRGALDDLDADPPPRNLQGAHDRMVEGLEGMVVLLDRMGQCHGAAQASAGDRRVCRQAIRQDFFDEIRNDFDEANTIYQAEGLALPGLGGDEGAGGSPGGDPEGGDEL